MIGLADFDRLSGLSRDAIVRAMGDLQLEVGDLYNLAVLVLHCCCGRPLTAPDGTTYDILGGQAGPENNPPRPAPFD